MSKSQPTQKRTPIVPRYRYLRSVGDRYRYIGDQSGKTIVSFAPVDGHIWVACDSVNRLLQFYFSC